MRFVFNEDIENHDYKIKYLRYLMVFSRSRNIFYGAKIEILCPETIRKPYITNISYYKIGNVYENGEVSLFLYKGICESNNPVIRISSLEICNYIRESIKKFCKSGNERYLVKFFRDLSETSGSPLEEILRRLYSESFYKNMR